MDQPYDLIIGLEVHVQLLTQSKMFCGCSTQFGASPNTQTCPVCIGMPGTLPVMNRRAFRLALRSAVALNCRIAPFTKWDRKNYYYPDLPKGYQISQFDLPFSSGGRLRISDPKGRVEPKDIGLIRVHLEEDAGKSMHDEAAGRADSRIDLNRAGVPLMEIVSQPDLRSPAEAKAFLTELKLLLWYLQVSDCNMQEGSLRVDANVNLHIPMSPGQQATPIVATPIVEVKNMNSFRAVERALAYEEKRQYDVWRQTGQRLGQVPKQTRGWDEVEQLTRPQRSKEESSDYRYFPDPDLVPVTVSEAEIAAIRAQQGRLPSEYRAMLETPPYGLSPYDSDVIVSQGEELAKYYLDLADASGDAKMASNWIQQDVLRTLNEQQITIDKFPVRARELGALIARVKAGDLDTSRGREVLAEMMASGRSAAEVMQSRGICKVDDESLSETYAEVLVENLHIVQQVKAGITKAAAALIGKAKKKNPNVSASKVRDDIELMIRQRQQFIMSIWRAAGLLSSDVVTDSAQLNADNIQKSLKDAALWLTPKYVEGYDPNDFSGVPERQLADLSEAVARFRGIAREVPPDAPVSIEELAIARPAFLTLIERLGEIVRQQWQSELSTKFGEVEAFCEQHNLRSFRESKPAGRERILGEYNVDWLHFQIGEHIFVLEPKGRFLPGAMGLVDIYDTTTGECISIYRRGENVWFIHAEDVGGTGPLPWDIVNFERALGQLMRRQVPR